MNHQIINNATLIIAIILATINIFSFLIMFLDKRRAEKNYNNKRVSEITLFFLASLFGGIGIYLGMIFFRHKNRKWHFYIGIPIILIQNICFIYLLYKFLSI